MRGNWASCKKCYGIQWYKKWPWPICNHTKLSIINSVICYYMTPIGGVHVQYQARSNSSLPMQVGYWASYSNLDAAQSLNLVLGHSTCNTHMRLR